MALVEPAATVLGEIPETAISVATVTDTVCEAGVALVAPSSSVTVSVTE
jgi:hypothetical protein